jgi:hypothetical protein
MIKFLKAWIFDWRFKRACKTADRYYKTTGYKVLVLMLGGKPVVKYRKVLKDEIKRKKWDCRLEILEKHALYKTY